VLISSLLVVDRQLTDAMHALPSWCLVPVWAGAHPSRNLYDKCYKTMPPELRTRFLATYTAFLENVVAPHVADPQGLVYQAMPTMRCHLPGTGKPLIRRHCDAEYFHQPNEINLWMPLTRTFDTNTLCVRRTLGIMNVVIRELLTQHTDWLTRHSQLG
jgi:hypothetical protein